MTRLKMPILLAALASASLAGSTWGSLMVSESAPTTVTEGNGTYDRIIFRITGLTGADTATGPNNAPAGALAIQGTFTAVSKDGGVASLAVPGDSTPTSPGFWQNYITSGQGGVKTLTNQDNATTYNYAASFANFPSLTPTGQSRSGTGTSTEDSLGDAATIAGNSASFSGGWFTTTAGGIQPQGVNGSTGILAQIFVTHGEDVNFTGIDTTYGSNSEPLTFAHQFPSPGR